MPCLRPPLTTSANSFFAGLRSGAYGGNLEASTAVRLASSFRYALGIAPLYAYQVEHGRVGTPAVVVADLTASLTQGIDALTRPVDALTHPATPATVGISRSAETPLQPAPVQAVHAAGTAPSGGRAAREQVSHTVMNEGVA